MKHIICLFLFCTIICACKEHDSCDGLINEVYHFPELPENHNMTIEEITEFWDLPKAVADCIPTEELIETCLDYPNLRLIMAGSNVQSGYNSLVKVRFRGIRELETRPNRGTLLLKKFKTIDPLGFDPNWQPVEIGAYLFDISYIEIIFSQYANLITLTNKEKIEFMEKAIDTYEKKKSGVMYYGLFGLECTTTLMGRLMYLNNYKPMVDLYNDNLIRELIDFYGPTSFETVEAVYNLSKGYLIHLKK
jgi:hypothetical protein